MNSELGYSIGALLYTPALNARVGQAVVQGTFETPFSLALCLEDTISPDLVPQAEAQLVQTLRTIRDGAEKGISLPRIFVRVREPEQMERVWTSIRDCREIFTGFIFPKYTVTNGPAYNHALERLNEKSHRTIYMMPILESPDLADFRRRPEVLGGIRDLVDSVSQLVLNVRVGGNDFCNQFSVRRHYDETIYDILPIAQLLGDILTAFLRDYVVSGPVWEFFASDNHEWKKGLQRELKLDKLNGFVGKTVIHPKQIPVVNDMLKVTRMDWEDAKAILNWNESGLQVGKSFGGERMNEVRTHYNWARKILLLADRYGVV